MLLLGVNAIMVGLIVLSWTGSGRLAVLGTLLMVGSTDLFRAHAWVLTEPIFLAGVLSGLWWLVADLERPRRAALAAAVVAIALAALTRYAGLAAIAAGTLAMALWGPTPPAGRWRRVTLFAVGSGAPLLVWLVRNRIVHGSLTGKQLVPHAIPVNRAKQGLDSVSAWLLPEAAPPAVRYSVLIAAALAIVMAWWYARGRADDGLDPARRARLRIGCRVFGAFALLYGLLVFGTIFLFDAQVPLDARLLTPLYATAVVLAMAGVAQFSARVPQARSLALAAIVLLAGISLTGTVSWAVGSQLTDMSRLAEPARQEVRSLRDDVRVPRTPRMRCKSSPTAGAPAPSRPIRSLAGRTSASLRSPPPRARSRGGQASSSLPPAALALVSAVRARAAERLRLVTIKRCGKAPCTAPRRPPARAEQVGRARA